MIRTTRKPRTVLRAEPSKEWLVFIFHPPTFFGKSSGQEKRQRRAGLTPGRTLQPPPLLHINGTGPAIAGPGRCPVLSPGLSLSLSAPLKSSLFASAHNPRGPRNNRWREFL